MGAPFEIRAELRYAYCDPFEIVFAWARSSPNARRASPNARGALVNIADRVTEGAQ